MINCNMIKRTKGFKNVEYAQLTQKPRTKSLAWRYFGIPADHDGNVLSEGQSICKLCSVSVSCKGGSTTNMISHLKLYHPTQFSSLKFKREITPTSKFEILDERMFKKQRTMVLCLNAEIAKQNNSRCDTEDANDISKSNTEIGMQYVSSCNTEIAIQNVSSCNAEILCTNAVAKFIATTMQPYSIVESLPFIEMIKALNPHYNLPDQNFFSNTAIPKLVNKTESHIKADLDLVNESNISITIDYWTCVANTPFIAVSAYFVDALWNMKSACLSCSRLDDDQTADNIKKILTSILTEWNLDAKELCSCTIDNEANFIKAISLLAVPHIPCFGHAINVAVNRALQIPILREAVLKVQKIQSTIWEDWKMRRDLIEIQQSMQMEPMNLPTVNKTKWWSILNLCRRCIQNKLPINQMLQAYPTKSSLILEENEISSINYLLSTTQLLEDITNNLSGEAYSTASTILPLLTKIKKSLQTKDMDNDLLKNIKSTILSALTEQYFSNKELLHILSMCTICDPRFRLKYAEDSDEIKNVALSHLIEIHKATDFKPNLAESTENNLNTSKIGLAMLLDDDDVEENDSLASKHARNELANYLSMPKLDLNENPFAWWNSHGDSFPNMKSLARKFLAIQGTSIPSERLFNTHGNIIDKKRVSLLPKNAGVFVFLAQNKDYI